MWFADRSNSGITQHQKSIPRTTGLADNVGRRSVRGIAKQFETERAIATLCLLQLYAPYNTARNTDEIAKESRSITMPCVHVNSRYVESDVPDLDVYDRYTLEWAVRSFASLYNGAVDRNAKDEAAEYRAAKERIKSHLAGNDVTRTV